MIFINLIKRKLYFFFKLLKRTNIKLFPRCWFYLYGINPNIPTFLHVFNIIFRLNLSGIKISFFSFLCYLAPASVTRQEGRRRGRPKRTRNDSNSMAVSQSSLPRPPKLCMSLIQYWILSLNIQLLDLQLKYSYFDF